MRCHSSPQQEKSVETKRRVLIFGESQLLRRLAAALRDSLLLDIMEQNRSNEISAPGSFRPDVILVDGAQITPEQFHHLLDYTPSSPSALISIDPLTYQLTVLSSPHCAEPLARLSQLIEILSLNLPHSI
jgi:hypothetical protein